MSESKEIRIKGARVHNLKNIDVNIKHKYFTVITGLSGSGKSSLAFDTLFSEGQRRYVESLSSYARQFLGRLDKPEVDQIKGISPAIAIEQKVKTNNPRSTVGTTTEVYDFLKLLFARVGKTYSPVSGKEVVKHRVSDVVDYLNSFEDGTRFTILAPNFFKSDIARSRFLDVLIDQGYSRLWKEGETYKLTDLKENEKINIEQSYIVIDRVSVEKESDENNSRLGDSVQLAFEEGRGECFVLRTDEKSPKMFSNRFELDGVEFVEPDVHFFTFNNPVGACKECDGYGSIIGIDKDLVIPNKKASIYEDAIAPFNGEKMSEWKQQMIIGGTKSGLSIHKPIAEFSPEEIELMWNGDQNFEGINDFFDYVKSKSYKIHYRILLSRYRGKTECPSCKGTRLRKDASYVKVGNYNLIELVLKPIKELRVIFDEIQLDEHDSKVAKRLLVEIQTRLRYLDEVGLGYLTLNRQANSLSGGESQRINLATNLGSGLVGSMYILDEPSIGLHSRDTERLIHILHNLKEIGNTVIVVEHDEDIMKAADEILDMGPEAGLFGGEVVFQGDHKQLLKAKGSLTADYLNRKLQIPIPEKRKTGKQFIKIEGARENNLKNLSLELPLQVLTCISGVSGSGKSTLVRNVLLPGVSRELGIFKDKKGDFDSVSFPKDCIEQIEFIDQNPIGRSSRSNPVTYVKAFDEIRDLFASQQISKIRGYKAGWFSFNVDGGRCEMCEGEGEVTISMQFMADVHLECETCKGSRYKNETLEVKYQDKNIADILAMSIDEAITFFETHLKKGGRATKEEKIINKLKPLQEVGLGYLKLGQSSSTLSGGEAQRIKLASFLIKGKKSAKTLFIFDEPTTGLHFHDIAKLLIAFEELVKMGHSLIVIEHNLDVLKCADHIVDLGPEGGKEGGKIVFQGTPEELVKSKESYTAQYMKEKLN
ncbi:MAG: excinuclease ABC subunit UvrA [Crocinitomicaceae bacterium]